MLSGRKVFRSFWTSRRAARPIPRTPLSTGEWHPANDAARKLWACVEAMRDIEDILLSRTAADVRQLKRLVTPLVSLRTAVVALGNYLNQQRDEAVHCR